MAAKYLTRREITAVIPMWPHEMDNRAELISKLERALRAERTRGLAGHHSYDLARHAAMLAIYRQLQNGAQITP